MTEEFNNWVFRYNPYNSKWHAATRENYRKLHNDPFGKDVINSSKIETLVELINRTDGDISKMNKLAK